MTVGLCCSGASSQKLPRRLTPPGGSLQAEHLPIFPRQRICLFANIALILSRCAPKVNPRFFEKKLGKKLHPVPLTAAVLTNPLPAVRLQPLYKAPGLRPCVSNVSCSLVLLGTIHPGRSFGRLWELQTVPRSRYVRAAPGYDAHFVIAWFPARYDSGSFPASGPCKFLQRGTMQPPGARRKPNCASLWTHRAAGREPYKEAGASPPAGGL